MERNSSPRVRVEQLKIHTLLYLGTYVEAEPGGVGVEGRGSKRGNSTIVITSHFSTSKVSIPGCRGAGQRNQKSWSREEKAI